MYICIYVYLYYMVSMGGVRQCIPEMIPLRDNANTDNIIIANKQR